MDDYLRSRQFHRIPGLLESSREKPEVRFDMIEEFSGTGVVFAARCPGEEGAPGKRAAQPAPSSREAGGPGGA